MPINPWDEQKEDTPLAAARGKKAPRARFGLAFSGGGIRSATFNLGIIQSLVDHRILGKVDYLSTVSGGGYIGGWLSALIQRAKVGSEAIAREHLARPIDHLRRYSNYLTPRYGLFSLDTLAAVANLARNLMLNQAVLICCLVALLLLPLLVEQGAIPLLDDWKTAPLALLLGSICIASGLIGIDTPEKNHWQFLRAAAGTGLGMIAALALARLLATPPDRLAEALNSWISTVLPITTTSLGSFSLVIVVAVAYGMLWIAAWLAALALTPGSSPAAQNPEPFFARFWRAVWFVIAPLAAGAALGGMLIGYGKAVENPAGVSPAVTLAFGGPIILILICFACTVHIGVGKRWFRESMREWLGRAGGLCLALAVAWALVFAAALYGAAILAYLEDWALAGGVAWAVTSGVGIWLARSEKTSGEHDGAKKAGRWREILAQAAPYVFIVGLLFSLAALAHWGLRSYAQLPDPPQESTPANCPVVVETCYPAAKCETVTLACQRNEWQQFTQQVSRIAEERQCITENHRGVIGIAFLVMVALGVFLAWRVDINMFSMHQFYRNRLARCYLGASNANRQPDPFTDFDLDDDLPLTRLAEQRPVHLVNCALNLTEVKALQWQERLSASFVFSPAQCGYRFACDGTAVEAAVPSPNYMNGTGWRREKGYGPYLGNAIAASGAAANPNQGYHTAPALAFIMTFFNVRLGRWVPNPKGKDANLESPKLGLWYLLSELFAATNESTPFINLSDGGHFENLGIYELVRRRCRLIVACDAGCDPEPSQFEDLGNAIRKCRVDFGARIEIDLSPLTAADPTRRRRFAVGAVDYADGRRGVLVYIKPLMLGTEPVDIRHYHAANPTFPQQSTADQWFDESQFESYRKLGELSGDAVFGQYPWNLDLSLGLDEWIEAVAERLEKSIPARPD